MREIVVEFRGERRKRSSSQAPKSRALVTLVVLLAALVLFTYHPASGPQIAVEPAQVTFPPVFVGSSSETKTITVRNTGSTAVRIDGPKLSGIAAADFYYGEGCTNKSIDPGQSCSFEVHVVPSTAGERIAQLTLASDATGAPAQEVVLLGEGKPPAVAELRADPMPVDFAHTTNQPATTDVVFTNPGSAVLAISTVDVEGSAEFTTNKACAGRTLQPGESCHETVTYTPSAQQGGSGNLVVTYDQSQVLRIPLQSAEQSKPPAAGRIVVNPQQITLAGTTAGPAPSVPLEIRNAGDAALQVSSVRPNQSGQFFTVLGDCSQNPIPPGQGCTLTVRSTLTTPGSPSGSIEISSDGGQAVVSVSANITTPAVSSISVSPSRLEVRPGTTNIITVSNSGNVPVRIKSFATSVPDLFALSERGAQTPCSPGMQLTPASSCEVSILLQSVPTAAQTASFEIAADAANSPQRVSLFAKGAPPPPPAQLRVDPQRIDFRGRVDDVNRQASLTIRNLGGLPLSVESPRVNQGRQFFALRGDCSSAPIQPGGGCALTVQLTLKGAGEAAGSIDLRSNGGQVTVPVSASLTQVTRPFVRLDPPRLEVGPGKANVITVTNTGNGPLNIQDFGTSVQQEFVITKAGTQTACIRGMQLAPGDSCQVGIVLRLLPGAVESGTFAISDDAADSPQQVSLFAQLPPPSPHR